ncbi:MAG: hypothetical protein NTX92_07085 [Euryarchaeota archaeon]|nr:hypothetical protein [Euryarchaeota archaeon]
MENYPQLSKAIAFIIILLFAGLTISQVLPASATKNAPMNEQVDLIINDDGSGNPTDKAVDVPPYIPDSGITPTLTINFTILGTNSSESTAFYGDDPGEDWKNISVIGDILNPVNETTLYHVGTKGDWICDITPTKPGGTIDLIILWDGEGADEETIQIVNGSFVRPMVESFIWGLDCNLTATITDMDGAPLKYANVYLIWKEDNYEFNETEGDNKVGNGLNGEYTFWIRETDQGGPLLKNITIIAQAYPEASFGGYGKVISVPSTENINFDIAYINDIYAELPSGGGVMFTDASFGLIINTGPDTITYDVLKAAKITVASDVEGASLGVGFNIYESSFPTIKPKQAWGSITDQNHFLVDFLKDGEELLNMTPHQTFFFDVSRQNFTGTAHFHITIQIGKRITFLETNVTYVEASEHHVELISGDRVKSHLHYTNTAVATLGPIAPILNFSFVRLIDGDPVQIQKIQSILKSRILQFIIPVIQFNVTHLSFSVTYPREIPQKPFFQRYLYMTGIQKDNITLINEPHQIIVNEMNGIFVMIRGTFFQMNPPRFAFAGNCSGVTIIK